MDDRGAVRKEGDGAWTAFLMIAFGVLGLVGAFSVYAAQIPMERALARSAALQDVLTASSGPDAAARIDALRPALDDSAPHVLTGDPSGLADRANAERIRMLTAFGHEAEDIGTRLRVVLAAFTAACALFGAAVLSIVRRQAVASVRDE